jgi:alpha-glucuronidase
MAHSRREFVATGLAGAAGLALAQGRPADLLASLAQQPPPDEDGYRLWLRYAPPGRAAEAYRRVLRQLVVEGATPTDRVINQELTTAIDAMLGGRIAAGDRVTDGTLIVGTPKGSAAIRELGWSEALRDAGPEGYRIAAATVAGRQAIAIASESEVGALYGTYHFLRLLQTGSSIERLDLTEHPRLHIRMLNHWDNLDGSVERGYAGRSLWHWDELPGTNDSRYVDYARANASIGINATAINNVNANARVLTPEYLAKVAALAAVWRPYGLRVYLSANVASPIVIGGLKTADPLDPGVIDWWRAKADEIYKAIPDFGGFLVKANSEGQPGPKDYGRTHAEGANCLADAVAPHGGHVVWRAFIYDEDVDPDRAKRAWLEFTKLDGQFKPNVLIQVKNGAIDFMPREPFHPLFGALNRTPIMAEIQATQEYTGQAKHLVYRGTMWEEFLQSDTWARGQGSTVARVLEGDVIPQRVTGMASVVNPGLDRNWCGHHFSQSNWYASGRLAWNPQLPARQIAEEWTRMTFTNDRPVVDAIATLLMGSRETFVNYTMPLGLHHLIGGNHYAPQPENDKAPRPDWTAVYYHRASAEGIGFDRSMQGDQAVAQYFPPVRDLFDSLATCPEIYLLWFHRCAWDYRLKSGQTLWDGLCDKYHTGARDAAAMQKAWDALASRIDPRRHREVAERLAIQVADAAKWSEHILAYFQTFSQRPIPSEA